MSNNNVIRRIDLPKNAIQQVWVETQQEDGTKPYVTTARLREGFDAERVIWDDVTFDFNTKENPLEGMLTLVGTTFASIRISFVGPAGSKARLYQQVSVKNSEGNLEIIRQPKHLEIEAKEDDFTSEKWLVCTISDNQN